MLLQPNRHKMVQMIIGKLGPKHEMPGGEGVESTSDIPDDEIALKTAMQKFIDAVHAKDAEMASNALCDFMEIHETYESKDDEPSELSDNPGYSGS